MDHDSPYRSTLRTERVSLEFLSLPLLETRAERQAREAARRRALDFAFGIAFTIGSIAALAILF